MIVALVAAASLALPAPTVTSFPQAQRATGLPTFCWTYQREWRSFSNSFSTGRDAIGLWLTDSHAIALSPEVCRPLRSWRTTSDAYLVSLAIFTLGHEATHAEQRASGRVMDEHEADCGGARKFQTLRRALRISRSLSLPFPVRGC